MLLATFYCIIPLYLSLLSVQTLRFVLQFEVNRLLVEMSLSIREPFPISNNFENNQESNVLKKAKMEDGQVRATQQGQKRAALSTITNNAMRIQPFRAAKQQVGETRSISCN